MYKKSYNVIFWIFFYQFVCHSWSVPLMKITGLIFLSGRTLTIGGWLNTFLPHCICFPKRGGPWRSVSGGPKWGSPALTRISKLFDCQKGRKCKLFHVWSFLPKFSYVTTHNSVVWLATGWLWMHAVNVTTNHLELISTLKWYPDIDRRWWLYS